MSGYSMITQLLNKSIEKVKNYCAQEETAISNKRKFEMEGEEEETSVKKKKKKKDKDQENAQDITVETEHSPGKKKKKKKDKIRNEDKEKSENEIISKLEADTEPSPGKKKKKKKDKNRNEDVENTEYEILVKLEPCSDSETRTKKKKKHKNRDKEKENESVEMLQNLEPEEDSNAKKKKKNKNKKHKEEEQVWVETGLVDDENLVNVKKKKKISDTDSRQVENILVENNFEPKSIQKRPSTDKDKTHIQDIYCPPDPDIITGQLYKVVMYILEENITVCKLNAVYTDSFPVKQMRDYLVQKLNANINFFTEEEDLKIRKRFKSLVDMKLVNNPKEFINQLNEQNGRVGMRKKNKATRNIVGLFLGQDLKNRIAHTVCQRMIYLITGVSLENIHYKYKEIRKQKETSEGPVFKVKQKAKRWTLDDDKILVKMVLKQRDGKGYMRVEHCVEKNVDWDPIAEYFKEFGRTRQLVRERWNRSVKMMLLESEQEPEAVYEYQRSLLEYVLRMGVKERREIRWKEVAKDFHPKTSAVLSQDFWNMIRHRTNETLSDKLNAALEALEKPTVGSYKAKVAKNETKSQLLDFYLSLSQK